MINQTVATFCAELEMLRASADYLNPSKLARRDELTENTKVHFSPKKT